MGCKNSPIFYLSVYVINILIIIGIYKLSILNKLGQAVNFENFLQTKYVGKKRFSLEGLEVLIPALYQAIHTGAKEGVKECMLGMAHRGRLNVLVNIFQKSYEDVFSEFEENITFDFSKHTPNKINIFIL